MSASLTPQQPELLTSWKEIASYLGKGVRTVQRWEQQYGLPVRRPNEKSKGIVHATRYELDQWLAIQWSQRPRELAQDSKADYACITEVRNGLDQSAALRQANRLLLKDVRSCVENMILECRALARSMNGTAPQKQVN
jgi:hypothetical protein